MIIKKIIIEGFRSINEPITLELGQINAIIGSNNSGKSNILNVINKLLGNNWVTKNTFIEEDVYNEIYEKDIIVEIEFDTAFNYEYLKGIFIKIPKVKFKYTRYLKGPFEGERRLEKECLDTNNEKIVILKNRPQKGKQNVYVPLTTIPQELQESFPVIFIGAERSLKNQLPSSRNSILGTIMQDINKDFLNEENTIEVTYEGEKKLISRKKRFDTAIREAIRTLKTDEFNKLEVAIKNNVLKQLGFDETADHDKFDIYFNPLDSLQFYTSLQLYVNEYGYTVNATNLGSGFQNAIVLSIIKAFEERKKQGALFLIEEPEIYLHPQLQRSLYKTLRKIGETNQVIYITHSPHFVTIPDFDEIILTKRDVNGTQVIKSSLEISPELKDKFRKELDPVRNEMFFAKKLLIVEGDTEKLAFPEFAKRMTLDFDYFGSTIIEVGGKRNLKTFIDLALSFKIPVGVVYDTDSSDFGKDKRNDEEEYNKILDAYKEMNVEVYSFSKNYEEECKRFYTEKNYLKFCETFGSNKTLRARLMAQDENIPIPDFVIPIITWLAT